jgi:hypothetical protein
VTLNERSPADLAVCDDPDDDVGRVRSPAVIAATQGKAPAALQIATGRGGLKLTTPPRRRAAAPPGPAMKSRRRPASAVAQKRALGRAVRWTSTRKILKSVIP